MTTKLPVRNERAGHDRRLIRPPENHTLDYEGEVAIVIGKTRRRITQADAYEHIAALTLCNEIYRTKLEKGDRGYSINNSYAPFSLFY